MSLNNNGAVYSELIEIHEDTVLKAIALKEGMTASEVSVGEYIITYSLDISSNPVDGGSVTITPKQENYSYGDEVTLEAVAGEGYNFDYWEGNLSGAENPVSLTINESKEITAVFAPIEYSVTFKVKGEDDTTLSGATVNLNGQKKQQMRMVW